MLAEAIAKTLKISLIEFNYTCYGKTSEVKIIKGQAKVERDEEMEIAGRYKVTYKIIPKSDIVLVKVIEKGTVFGSCEGEIAELVGVNRTFYLYSNGRWQKI